MAPDVLRDGAVVRRRPRRFLLSAAVGVTADPVSTGSRLRERPVTSTTRLRGSACPRVSRKAGRTDTCCDLGTWRRFATGSLHKKRKRRQRLSSRPGAVAIDGPPVGCALLTTLPRCATPSLRSSRLARGRLTTATGVPGQRYSGRGGGSRAPRRGRPSVTRPCCGVVTAAGRRWRALRAVDGDGPCRQSRGYRFLGGRPM